MLSTASLHFVQIAHVGTFTFSAGLSQHLSPMVVLAGVLPVPRRRVLLRCATTRLGRMVRAAEAVKMRLEFFSPPASAKNRQGKCLGNCSKIGQGKRSANKLWPQPGRSFPNILFIHLSQLRFVDSVFLNPGLVVQAIALGERSYAKG